MIFPKDLLVVDLEATGLDWDLHEILQIGAVILDRKTLKEKKHFEIKIKPLKWSRRDPEALKRCALTYEDVKFGTTLKTALTEFVRFAGKNTILCQYGDFDSRWLRGKFKKLNIPYPFDYHTLDIWSVACAYFAKHNKLTHKQIFTGFNMETTLKHFSIPLSATRHDALGDARYEAEILRKLLKN